MKRAVRTVGIVAALALALGLGGCIYDPGYYHRGGVVYTDGTVGAGAVNGNAVVHSDDDVAYGSYVAPGYYYGTAYYGPGYYGPSYYGYGWPYATFGLGFGLGYGWYGHGGYHGPWRHGGEHYPHGGWTGRGGGSYGHGGSHSSGGGHSSGSHSSGSRH